MTRPSKGASGSTRLLRSKASKLVTTWLDSPAKQDFSDTTFLGEPVLAKQALDNLSTWAAKWGMDFNISAK
jgi:hypothetical protein